jgi:hypothetical protein
MSLLTKASLIATPTAYGDGVLNSVKPTNGDGDFDFARASAATRVNEQGLIEKERGNFLLQSNQFDTTWTEDNTTLTSGQSGYDGSSDAWRVEANTDALTRVIQSQSISANTPVTISVYAKSGNVDFIKFNLVTSGTNSISTFDLTDGSVYNSNAIDENWQSIGNGWVRISATFVNSDAITEVRFEVRNTEGTPALSGDFVYIQDAQLEQGLVATSVIETTTTAVYEGITDNIPRINYENGIGSFLLEPQRTNLITYSEYFNGLDLTFATVDDNSETSPEGYINAAKLYDDSNNAQHRVAENISVVNGTTYTWSIFAKKGSLRYCYLFSRADGSQRYFFDLQEGTAITSGGKIEDYGNGWFRISAQITSSTTSNEPFGFNLTNTPSNNTYIGTGTDYHIIYGFQVEEGYLTSYIPTYGTSVTFASETCNNAGDSSLFNDSEGVLYAEIAALDDDLTQRYISISNGSIGNAVRIHYHTDSNSIRGQVRAGGSIEASLTHIVSDIKDFHKVAISYKENDVKLYVDGVEVATDTSATMPTGLDELSFDRGDGGLPFYGKTKMVAIFKEALSDSELECLTSL